MHYFDAIMEKVGHDGTIENWMDRFLTEIWEEPSTIETATSTTSTTSDSQDYYVNFDIFSKRKKRQSSSLSHQYDAPPKWKELKKRLATNPHQKYVVSKQVS